jgi:eukaryotic-like serine/threonine-protein kinase
LSDDWRLFKARSLLGGALSGQEKYAEAEPLLVQGYEGMKRREAQIPPQGRPFLTEAAERLYEAKGELEKAAEWRKKRTKAKGGLQRLGALCKGISRLWRRSLVE